MRSVLAKLTGRANGEAVIRVLGGLLLLAAAIGWAGTLLVGAGYAWFCIAWLHAPPFLVLAVTLPVMLALLAIFSGFAWAGSRLVRASPRPAPSR